MITRESETLLTLKSCRAMLRESAKQFRLRSDKGHAEMADMHADMADIAIDKEMAGSAK